MRIHLFYTILSKSSKLKAFYESEAAKQLFIRSLVSLMPFRDLENGNGH